MSDLTYLRIPGHWASKFYLGGSSSGGGIVKDLANTSTPFIFGTGNWSIEFFLYLEQSMVAANLIDFRYTSDGIQPTIYMNSDGKVVYRENSNNRITSTTVLASNQWYHIAVCKSSNVTRLFINGIKEGADFADTDNYTVQSTQYPVSILRYVNAATGYSCKGAISNLRIQKGYAQYTADFTVPTEPLTVTANTSLLTCMDSTLTDSSTYNFTVINYNGNAYDPQIYYLPSPFGTTNLDSTTLAYQADVFELSVISSEKYEYSTDPQTFSTISTATYENRVSVTPTLDYTNLGFELSPINEKYISEIDPQYVSASAINTSKYENRVSVTPTLDYTNFGFELPPLGASTGNDGGTTVVSSVQQYWS